MTKRSCGSCNMCCKLLGIYEIAKAPGRWCPHCTIGVGCNIYATRPPSCAEFQCMWLANPELSDGMRPDRSKVVLIATEGEDFVVAQLDPGAPDAMRRPAMRELAERIKLAGRAIIMIIGERVPMIDAPATWSPARRNALELGVLGARIKAIES